MCSSKWPLLLDLTKDECKRILRNLELDAYGSIVSVFRAQGDLNKEKKRMLTDLQTALSISTERHRAEIRRAVNDEQLATVANSVAGPDISTEWHIEGRRLVPIMPRLVPQTAFTVTAESLANQQAQKNITLPTPASTGNYERAGSSAPPTPCSNIATSSSITTKVARPPSPGSSIPTSNVLVLPSGMSIHIKDETPFAIEEEIQMKHRRRTTSAESLIHPKSIQVPVTPPASQTVPPQLPHHVLAPGSPPPTRLPAAKSPVKHHAVTTTPSGQKVIIVSSTMSGTTPASAAAVVSHAASPAAGTPRSVSAVPLVKTSSATGAITTTVNTVLYPRPSIVVSGTSVPAEHTVSRSNAFSIASTGANSNSTGSIPTPVYQNVPFAGTPRPRVRTITARPRTPQQSLRAASHIGTPQPIAPSSQNIHIRPATKPTIHIKQEGSMKIITQGTPSTAGRILPKPTPSQVLVVSTAQSSMGTTRINTPGGASHIQGGKVLNISTSGGRILATSTPRTTGANVVTVNPKTLQLTTIKSSGITTGTRLTTASGVSKPNVIVVQKAQAKKGTNSATPTVQVARTSGPVSSPFEKELVSFLQRQEPGTKPAAGQQQQQQRSILERRIGRPSNSAESLPRKHVVVRQKSDGGRVRSVTLQGGSKSSILAELIQAVGMSSEHMGTPAEQAGSFTEDSRAVASITSLGGIPDNLNISQNQWVEYDMQGEGGSFLQPAQGTKIITSESTDVSAIRALLDLQAGNSTGKGIRTHLHRPAHVELSSLQSQGGELTLEPISVEERGDSDPDIQIVGTSGLDDVPVPVTVKRTIPIHQRQKVHVVDETGSRLHVQIADHDQLAQLTQLSNLQDHQSQEIVGEIDPHTGALITSEGIQASTDSMDVDGVAIQVISSEDHEAEQAALMAETRATKTIILNTSDGKGNSHPSQATTTVIDPSALGLLDQNQTRTVATSANEKLDFLSNALNQAQIDLDCYQFVEEDGETKVLMQDGANMNNSQHMYVSSNESTPNQATTLVSILSRPSQSIAVSASNYSFAAEDSKHSDASTSQVEILEPQEKLPDLLASSTPTSSHISRTVPKATTIQGKVIPVHQIKSKTQFIPIHDAEKRGLSTVHVIKSSGSTNNSALATSLSGMPTTVSMVSGVSVASEPGSLDPGHMNFEDLTSQQLEGDLSSEEVLVSGNYVESAGDVAQSIRLSKRKRKAPLAPDEISSPTHGGWTRLAAGVLQRVMRVRGSYKEKGELNAASWFTQPVDPREVPDYYDIIQNPMDFSTIKKKLEMTQYTDLEDFHVDMLLVRDNCHRYNPPGTEVRRDCDEVFSIYSGEYDKLVTRWQQSHNASSPSSKKPRLDRSPVRP